MSRKTPSDSSADAIDTQLSITDPDRVRGHDDVEVTVETELHDDVEDFNSAVAGQVVVAVENEDGDLLVLCNDELGIAILPHGEVEEGEDWAAVAREKCKKLTGVSVTLDGVDLLREVDHVTGKEGKPHHTTDRLVFAGQPVGGEIQECKQSADAGGDDWWACWVDGLPEGIDAPPGGPGDDLRYALD